MHLNHARRLIEQFDFATLFADELLWNRLRSSVLIDVGGNDLLLQTIAEKKYVQVLLCPAPKDGSLPTYPIRQKIERQVTRQVREHLIIYANAALTAQVWQWVAREPGQPAAYREIIWQKGQPADLLLEKLGLIAFRIEEDDTLLTVLDVAGKLRDAFDRDKLTKRFYDDFKLERDAFLNFIHGMPADAAAWYTSVMINRLMFVYFLQRKRLANNEGFLDNRHDYLRHHLTETQRALGKNRFYRDFLCPLFFQGFAQSEHRDEVRARFGDIPFLNGGLFNRHPLEEQYGSEISIADAVFEKLFDFFDGWDWHLDDRPLARKDGRDINPEVLGYIFEKYINQKQLGAYYTKEDITGYICRNTIVPGLLDKIRTRCGVVFDRAAWPLLEQDPDRYVWPAMRYGAVQPLPDDIAAGLDPNQPDIVKRRMPWNHRAPETHALPTEIWREVIVRRQRLDEVRVQLGAGQVKEINDLITYNLDIAQFAEDAIARSEDPAIVRALWRALVGVVPDIGSSQREFEYGFSVLDPTCGSGAFLFAALNILEPLYRACLTRMRAFVLQADLDGERQKFPDFRKVLADVDSRPNESYFICKSIIVNNLYGVDIVEEGVEIAKLRLFLKLVSQLEDKRHIEPLPDIDFNIRAGNALVGFATYDEVKKAVTHEAASGQGKMLFDDAMTLIEQDAHVAERAYLRFRQQQVALGGEVTAEDKKALRDQLTALEERLTWYLAREYGVNPKRSDVLENWKASHKPFHWFVDFYGIINAGGFDAVVGNPPYIVFPSSKISYDIEPLGYRTLTCGNLYAYCFERALSLTSRAADIGLIVQLTSMSAEKLVRMQELIKARGFTGIVPFPRRPESVFDGVEMPVAIWLSRPAPQPLVATSRVRRFYTEERKTEIERLSLYAHNVGLGNHRIGKLGSDIERRIADRLADGTRALGTLAVKHGKHVVYYQEACRYWLKASHKASKFRRNGEEVSQPHGRELALVSKQAARLVACVLNSSLFYWYYSTFSDCEHVNDSLVRLFPVPLDWERKDWIAPSGDLHAELQRHATPKKIHTKQGHVIEYLELDAGKAKAVIDRIDLLLGELYGFRVDELDFIVNYDVKYRLGETLGFDDD